VAGGAGPGRGAEAMSLPGFQGRVALVTGAGQGIGAAIADRLGAEGCQVAVNSLTPAKAEATAGRLRAAGAHALAVHADVSDSKQVDAMVAGVERELGPVQVLVNNAAYLEMERMLDQDVATWTRMIDVDLTGPFLCARRVLPRMLEARWGRIVMVGSIWGLIGARGASAYCAAKGGLVEMTRALAAEVGPGGVSVTAIAPGTIDTPQLEADARFAGTTLEEMKARYAVDTLVGRIGTAQEIAGMVAFLASDDGAAFSGQTVPVTGGRAE
jgi:2-hydroxycyclohexanecarboxyl-CoA dehydrogenase